MIKITSKVEIDSSASTSSSTDNQVSTSVNVRALGDQLIYACEIARVLFKVLELLSKDVPLTFGNLEAYAEVKQLAKIFRPYNIIPQFDNNENHSIRRLPELQTAINALNHHPWSAPTHENKRDEEIISGMLEQVDYPSASRSHERPACQESEPGVPEMETADKPAGGIQVPELLIFLFSVHVLIFLVLFVVFIINLCAESNNQNGAV
ncbi:PREDICTED: callose synthase 2-like [Camelina sativa]|uniref:Callose synthase 2-like n=1 Tax=Camelina sativa TaxID=90675 RepID=A0ABM1Q8E9_CAMSA|nr:PREDICTED: callose synthase 2-like [Camelina sativa]